MLLYGKNVFEETIANNSQLIDRIYIRQGYEDRYAARIRDRSLINLVQEEFFRKNLNGKKHQFVAVEFGSFPFKSYTYLKDHFDNNNIFILLDSIKDPCNLGNIIRTACGLNIDGIILTKDRTAGITPAVFAASSGYVNRMPIIRITNPSNMVKMFRKWSYWVASVDVDGKTSIKSDAVDIPLPVVVAFGSEGEGVRDLYRKKADFSIRIPQKDGFDSFNLANAVTIVMWELSKQKI
jgi:23S rRNA (guanosine2251-2'-O)-methyltransferase